MAMTFEQMSATISHMAFKCIGLEEKLQLAANEIQARDKQIAELKALVERQQAVQLRQQELIEKHEVTVADNVVPLQTATDHGERILTRGEPVILDDKTPF